MKKRTGRMIAAAAGILIAAETAAAPLKAQAAAWQQQGEKLYAYDDAGNLLTNTLVPYGGFVYAVGEDGSMQTGWTSLNGANYCFDEQGRLLAGGATLDGYEVNELGQCIATIGVAPSQIAMAEQRPSPSSASLMSGAAPLRRGWTAPALWSMRMTQPSESGFSTTRIFSPSSGRLLLSLPCSREISAATTGTGTARWTTSRSTSEEERSSRQAPAKTW